MSCDWRKRAPHIKVDPIVTQRFQVQNHRNGVVDGSRENLWHEVVSIVVLRLHIAHVTAHEATPLHAHERGVVAIDATKYPGMCAAPHMTSVALQRCRQYFEILLHFYPKIRNYHPIHD